MMLPASLHDKRENNGADPRRSHPDAFRADRDARDASADWVIDSQPTASASTAPSHNPADGDPRTGA